VLELGEDESGAGNVADLADPLDLHQLNAQERKLVTLIAQGPPTPRSPPRCPSASAQSAPNSTGSAARPENGAAPT
jgi:hypothetical protein